MLEYKIMKFELGKSLKLKRAVDNAT